jgi:hypothetical protein
MVQNASAAETTRIGVGGRIMLSDQYKRELAQIAKDIGKVHTDISKEEENARKARTAMAQKQSLAQRASSVSMRDSYLRQAESEHKKVEAAEKKIGAHRDKLSGLLSRQNSKEQSLRSAERNEQAARDRAAEARRRKEKAEQATQDREAARRRQIEKDHAREMARLSSPTVHHIYIREPEPEKLRVLYLTASPKTPNLPGLRVDTEVNNVLKALRGAGRKDMVDLLQRPAATIEDVIDGINDHRPHVVHFSGHAENGLLFDTADPLEVGDQLVGYDAVASVLAATDQPPTLVVLNACRTIEGVERLNEVAAVVVATNDTVTDASSAIFATHFYGAIAAGQSIGHAVEQARAMIALALPDEPDVLTVNAADGVDPDRLTLVTPVAGDG